MGAAGKPSFIFITYEVFMRFYANEYSVGYFGLISRLVCIGCLFVWVVWVCVVRVCVLVCGGCPCVSCCVS